MKSIPADASVYVLLALLQKLIGEFFLSLGREIWREFCGIFLTHEIKAQTFRENFGAFFVRKFVPQKKSFVPTSFCRRATLSVCNFSRGGVNDSCLPFSQLVGFKPMIADSCPF